MYNTITQKHNKERYQFHFTVIYYVLCTMKLKHPLRQHAVKVDYCIIYLIIVIRLKYMLIKSILCDYIDGSNKTPYRCIEQKYTYNKYFEFEDVTFPAL